MSSMKDFFTGLVVGFLAFTEEGKKFSKYTREMSVKCGKEAIKQFNEFNNTKKGEDEQCTNTTNTGKQ